MEGSAIFTALCTPNFGVATWWFGTCFLSPYLAWQLLRVTAWGFRRSHIEK